MIQRQVEHIHASHSFLANAFNRISPMDLYKNEMTTSKIQKNSIAEWTRIIKGTSRYSHKNVTIQLQARRLHSQQKDSYRRIVTGKSEFCVHTVILQKLKKRPKGSLFLMEEMAEGYAETVMPSDFLSLA